MPDPTSKDFWMVVWLIAVLLISWRFNNLGIPGPWKRDKIW
jgi:hypothetical protein